MKNIPFLIGFAEKTESVATHGRYDRHAQMRVLGNGSISSSGVMATQPTHIETGTGGHNDTDTDAVED